MKRDLIKKQHDFIRIVYALIFSSLVAVTFIVIGAERAHSFFYGFLFVNLFLAYLPLVFAVWLCHRLIKTPWLSVGNVILTILWFGLLPNSFYLITDLIHAQGSVGIDLLYNDVMLLLCIFNAIVAGYISLYLIHWELLKRFYYRNAHIVVGLILLICSFAIYLGRYLRWNSWDVITNPAGLVFDVSDSITTPSTHPEIFSTTISFFFLLTAMYVVIWQITRVLNRVE